jgi:hypothetical protein
MLFEFHIVYTHRLPSAAGPWDPAGPLETIRAFAETEEAAETQVASNCRYVLSITRLRAVIDWQKPAFSHEEAAVFLGCSVRAVYDYQAAGLLPRPDRHKAASIFLRADLEKLVRTLMKPPTTHNPNPPQDERFITSPSSNGRS